MGQQTQAQQIQCLELAHGVPRKNQSGVSMCRCVGFGSVCWADMTVSAQMGRGSGSMLLKTSVYGMRAMLLSLTCKTDIKSMNSYVSSAHDMRRGAYIRCASHILAPQSLRSRRDQN